MIKLYLFNSAAGKKEEFKPINPSKVSMYVCGPTVYSRAHVGNMRSVAVFDCLYRLLQFVYGKGNVTFVRNITDVDDKIINVSKERNLGIEQITNEATDWFHQDCDYLHCLRPTIEPKATAYIDNMIEAIERLVDTRHAYVSNGNVLFAVDSFKNYGKLANKKVGELTAGSRVAIEEYKTNNPADFILWKPSKNGEPGWNSPFGFGRPGWHIECSVMSVDTLGIDFDIHGGGVDLKFPHHENEIAQSVCAFGGCFANHWIHNGALVIDGDKMSKSLGNIVTVEDLREIGVLGSSIKYMMLSAHYRQPLNFSGKAMESTQKFITKAIVSLSSYLPHLYENPTFIKEAKLNALLDDMNIPKFLSFFGEMINILVASSNNCFSDNNICKDDIPSVANELFNCGTLIGLWNLESLKKDYTRLQSPKNQCLIVGAVTNTNIDQADHHAHTQMSDVVLTQVPTQILSSEKTPQKLCYSKFSLTANSRTFSNCDAIVFLNNSIEEILVFLGLNSCNSESKVKVSVSLATTLHTGELKESSTSTYCSIKKDENDMVEFIPTTGEDAIKCFKINRWSLKQIWELSQERLEFKKSGNFTEADALRDRLDEMYKAKIIDRKDGSIEAIRIFID